MVMEVVKLDIEEAVVVDVSLLNFSYFKLMVYFSALATFLIGPLASED